MDADHCVFLGRLIKCRHCKAVQQIPFQCLTLKAASLIEEFTDTHAFCEPAKPKPPGPGVLCPNCQSRNHWCKESRNELGYTRRRLECKNCEHRFTSHEVLAPDFNLQPPRSEAP